MADDQYNLKDLPEFNDIEPKTVATNTESSLSEVATENTSENEATKELEKNKKNSSATKVVTTVATTLVVVSSSSIFGFSFGTTNVAQIDRMQLADHNTIHYKFSTTNKKDQIINFTVASPTANIFSEDISEKKTYEGVITDLAYSTKYTCKITAQSKDSSTISDVFTKVITTDSQPVSYVDNLTDIQPFNYRITSSIVSYNLSIYENRLVVTRFESK